MNQSKNFPLKNHGSRGADIVNAIFLKLADQQQMRVPVGLEHDRVTEGQYYFRRHIRAYITLLKTNASRGSG